MKAILIILTLGVLAVSCSSKDKKEMKDQSVKAVEPVKTEAEAKVAETMKPTEGSIMKTECTLNKDSRGISVDKNGDNGCVVNYTKNGETKQVGRSAVGITYCEEIANRISTNLKNAGFACQ